jgi:hypothetical protein
MEWPRTWKEGGLSWKELVVDEQLLRFPEDRSASERLLYNEINRPFLSIAPSAI